MSRPLVRKDVTLLRLKTSARPGVQQRWASVTFRDARGLREQITNRARGDWPGQPIRVDLPSESPSDLGHIFINGEHVARWVLVAPAIEN